MVHVEWHIFLSTVASLTSFNFQKVCHLVLPGVKRIEGTERCWVVEVVGMV